MQVVIRQICKGGDMQACKQDCLVELNGSVGAKGMNGLWVVLLVRLWGRVGGVR